MKQLIIYIYVHINDIPKQNFHSEKKWIAIYNFSGIVSITRYHSTTIRFITMYKISKYCACTTKCKSSFLQHNNYDVYCI